MSYELSRNTLEAYVAERLYNYGYPGQAHRMPDDIYSRCCELTELASYFGISTQKGEGTGRQGGVCEPTPRK